LVGLGKNIVAIRNHTHAAFLHLFLLACGTNKVNVGVVRNDGGRNGGTEVGREVSTSGDSAQPSVASVCKPGECSAVTMTFVPKTSNNPIFELANQGAQSAALDLSVAVGGSVTVGYRAPRELNLEAQQAQVKAAIDTKTNGLIVSCIEDGITPLINQAVDEGIPVITFDSDCPNSKRMTYYSLQNEDAGSKAADLLVSVMGKGLKRVGILTGREGADNLKRRVDGFNTRLAAKYSDVQVVVTRSCMETGESCRMAIEDEILTEYPDLDGLFITGLWGVQAACTCDTAGRSCTCDESQMPKWKAAAKGKLKTVSFDTLPFELTLMKQGYLSALISQKYFDWGYDTVTLMFGHLTQGRVVSDFVDSGFDVVCLNNVDDMSSKWKANDFSAPVTPDCDIPTP
jgi:ribose transport system substrate-binding protein